MDGDARPARVASRSSRRSDYSTITDDVAAARKR
jgi:hypothetical protein